MTDKIREYIILISKAILAGILIALAGVAFLNAPNKIIGSLLFSVGLIAVIILEANLYTGKIGYVNTKKKAIDASIILIINLLSAFIVGIIYRSTIGVSTAMDSRLAKEWYRVLLDGIGCGALIYIAVESYKRTKNLAPVIICVMAFILAGFEHCIADIFYYGASVLTLKGFLYILLIIVGNSIGSLVVRGLQVSFRREN